MKTHLRTTRLSFAAPAKTPGRVTIRCRDACSYPRQRTVTARTWGQLSGYDESTFDGACCLELGIGAFLK